MSRTRSITVYAVLIGVAFIGMRLVGMFEKDSVPNEVSGSEFLLALIGFVLFLGALVGMILLIRQNMRPMSGKEISQWKEFRDGGKSNYVVRAGLRGILVGLLAMTWPAIDDYLKVKSLKLMVGSLWIYVAVVLICICGTLYAAVRTWDANERDYKALVPSRSR